MTDAIPSGDGSGISGPLGHPDVAFCICEESWFRLTGLVAFDLDGAIIGYSGNPTCSDCGDVKPQGFKGDHPWQFRASNDETPPPDPEV